MESLTKYRQSEETLRIMTEKCLAPGRMISCQELTEGYFNMAYEITLDDGRTAILKIAPSKEVRVMTYEKNIMHSEVEAMRLARRRPGICVPEIYASDDSCTICDSPYFFMEKLRGRSLSSVKDGMAEDVVQEIYRETGRVLRLVNGIVCPRFGYPGQAEYQGDAWYPVFRKMILGGISDARRGNVDLKISPEKILEKLEEDRGIFEEVTVPVLVHWDCWDGNLFVEDGKLTGIIDWERCLWADPLMEVGFRTYAPNRAFQEGYGLTVFDKGQQRRALWYDVYTMLLVALECEYRKYDTMEMYEWSTGVLAEQFAKL